MYIFVSGGKTMGHISPLLGIILSLKDKYDFIYFGLKNSMEEAVCKKYNISFCPLEVIPFNRKNLFMNIKTFYLIYKSKRFIKNTYKQFDPLCIISSGGFVSIPLVLAFKNKKSILLESNTTLGLANHYLLKKVDYLGVQFDTVKSKKRRLVGNPIPLFKSSFDHYYFYINERIVLFVGGSNGAYDVVKCAYEFNLKYPDIKIFVITGEKYYDKFIFNDNAKVYKKIPELSGILNKFNLVISRAGGATITELIASSVPFILFPSENVSANHQVLNAEYLSNLGVCKMIRDCSNDSIEMIYNILNDQEKQKCMIENQDKIRINNSIAKIEKLIKS